MRGDHMAVVETERLGRILVVRMNRPERLNALNGEMRTRLAETWTEFRHDDRLDVAIFTGTGRGFCAGEDMRESLQRGVPGGQRPAIEDPFMSGALEKPVIAAVNGQALAARRLQSRARGEPALPDRDGDGARLSLHRRALLRDRLPQPPGRGRSADPECHCDGRASLDQIGRA